MRFLRRRSKDTPKSAELDDDMRAFVDSLRTKHQLDQEPAGMSRKEQEEYRRQTQKIKDEVLESFDAGYRQAAGMNMKPKKRKR